MHLWYINKDGSPKTARRPRVCDVCRSTGCGCSLPFRSTRKTRFLAALDKKPIFFWWRMWKRSNDQGNSAAEGRPTSGASEG